MKIYKEITTNRELAVDPVARVIALGFFDGVHVGHQQLLAAMREKARQQGLHPAVLTFQTPPAKLFDNMTFPGLLQSEEQRYQVLAEQGAQEIVALPTEAAVLDMPAVDFLQDLLYQKLSARVLVVGTDFTFGQGAKGNVHMLYDFAHHHDLEVCVVPDYIWQGRVLSSTWIRQKIKDGEVVSAAQMMGRPYTHCGQVVAGQKLGRKLGFPTLNVHPDPALVLPPRGVYLSRVSYLEAGHRVSLPAITNLGVKPTVSVGDQLTSESFILVDHVPGYGCTIQVEYLDFMRAEVKFADLDQLQTQVLNDIAQARQAFGLY